MAEEEWSQSKLSLYQRCGEAYRRRYIEKDVQPAPLRVRAGSAVHAVAALMAKARMGLMSGHAPKEPVFTKVDEVAAAAFEQQLEAEVVLTPREKAEGSEGMHVGRAKDDVVQMARAFVPVVKALDVVAVERKVTVKPQDSDIRLVGTIDLITRDPATGGDVIDDVKTARRSPPRNAADVSAQLTMYGMLRAAETGKLPVAYRLHHLVRTPKSSVARYISLATRRDVNDLRALVRRINTAVDGVRKGVFTPAQPGVAWWCAPDWCEYWQTCKYVNPKEEHGDDE